MIKNSIQLPTIYTNLRGVAFIDAKYLNFQGDFIENCIFFLDKLQEYQPNYNLDTMVVLDNTFLNLQAKLHLKFLHKENNFVGSNELYVESYKFDKMNLFQSNVYLINLKETQNMKIENLYCSHSQLSLNNAKEIRNQFEQISILNSVLFRSQLYNILNNLNTLLIQDSTLLSTKINSDILDELKYMTLTNSFFIGDDDFNHQFVLLHKDKFQYPLLINITSCKFFQFKEVFIQDDFNSQYQLLSTQENQITFKIYVQDITLRQNKQNLHFGLFNLPNMKIISQNPTNPEQEKLVYYSQDQPIYSDHPKMKYLSHPYKVEEYQNRIIFLKFIHAKYQDQQLFDKFEILSQNMLYFRNDKTISLMGKTITFYLKAGQFIINQNISLKNPKITELVFQLSNVSFKGIPTINKIHFQSDQRAIKSFTFERYHSNINYDKNNENKISSTQNQNGIIEILIEEINVTSMHILKIEYCNEGEFLNNGQCVYRCFDSYTLGFYCNQMYNDGYYIDSNDNNKCKYCIFGCEKCIDHQTCSICKPNFYNQDGICLLECLEGYSAQGSSCVKCPENCRKCNSNGQCEECLDQNMDADCKKCELDQFSHNGKCYQCPIYCSSCNEINSYDCIQCEQGYTKYNGLCQQDQNQICPQGQTFTSDGCQSCSEGCLSCAKYDPLNSCLSCYSNYNQLTEGQNNTILCQKCPEGMFSKYNECQNCHPLCQKQKGCYGQSIIQCY